MFSGNIQGLPDCLATDINEEMKVAAAYAIVETIPEESLCADYIIPSVFDKKVVSKVASAVKKAAIESGIAAKEVG